MPYSSSPAIVIHCWLPDLNPLAAGCVTGAGAVGVVAYALLEALSWSVLLLSVLGFSALLLWCTYCRVTVTSERLTILGCGLFRRPRYSSPLAALALEHCWALSGAYVPPNTTPELELYTDWDWDIPDDFVTAKYQGEQITSFFRLSQYADIRAAVATMVRHSASSDSSASTSYA